MCLQRKSTKKDRKKITDGIPKTGMKVYKVVAVHVESGGYFPPYSVLNTITRKWIRRIRYKKGLNEAKITRKIETTMRIGRTYETECNGYYQAGYHFYTERKHARQAARFLLKHYRETCDNHRLKEENFIFKTITCTIKKSWITMIGKQYSIVRGEYDCNPIDKNTMLTIIVAKKALFPEIREKIKTSVTI